jgi:hypothetical protein
MQKKKVAGDLSASPPKKHHPHPAHPSQHNTQDLSKSTEDASSMVVIKPLTSDMLKKLDQIEEEETEQLA